MAVDIIKTLNSKQSEMFPKTCIYIIVIWVPIQYWLTKDLQLLPIYFVWIDEFLLVVLTALWLYRVLLYKEEFVKNPINMPILWFLIIGIISGIINQVDPIQTVLGIRGVFQYAMIFYAIINLKLEEDFLKKLVFISLAIAIGQFFISIYQAQAAGWHVFGSKGLDLIYGTMSKGGANGLGYFTLMNIFNVMGLILYKKGSKLHYYAFLFLLYVPLLLSSARMAYFILIVFFVILMISNIIPLKKYIHFLLPIAVLILGLIFFVNKGGGPTKQAYFSFKQMFQMEMDMQRVGRLGFYPVAYDVLTDTKLGPLIGRGPGNFSSYTGYRYKSPLLFDLFGTTLKEGRTYHSQIIATTVEFGFLGIIVFFFIIYRFYKIRNLVYNSTQSMFWKGIAVGFSGLLLIFVIPTIIANIWEVQYIALYFWLYGGILYKIYILERKRLPDENLVS